MDNILKITAELNKEILDCECYKEYLAAQNKIENNEEFKNIIIQFKKVQYDFESKRLNNIEVSFEEERYLSNLYADLAIIEDVNYFLESEEKFFKLLNRINNSIFNGVRIGIISE